MNTTLMSPNQVCEAAGIRAVPTVLTDKSVVWDVKLGNGEFEISCTTEENARALVRDIAKAIQTYGMERTEAARK